MFLKSKGSESSKIRIQSLWILAALGLQLLLGIITNLFVMIPSSHPGAKAHEYFVGVAQVLGWSLFSGLPSLALHVALGLLLILGSLVLLIRAIKMRHKKWIIVASFGFFGILSASFNGSSFVIYGEDFSSLAMEIGFLISATAYVLGLLIKT